MAKSLDIIIIGGGLIGATTALALSEAGYQVAVVEAQESLAINDSDPIDLRVSALNPGSQQFLYDLGIWPALDKHRIQSFTHMHVWDTPGQGEINFTAKDANTTHLGHIVENRALQNAAVNLAKAAGVQWHCPATFNQCLNDDEQVIVTLDTGDILKAKLLIAADGVNSKVRESVGIAVTRKDYEQRGIVATIETEEAHQLTAWQRFLPDSVIAFLPLPGHDHKHCSIVWSVRQPKADQLLEDDAELFLAQLNIAFDHKLGDIKLVSERKSFPLYGLHANTYIDTRLALIGDAAHQIHPLAGQGANLGIADIKELIDILKDKPLDPGKHSLLRKYERARHSENMIMLKSMEGFQELFMNDNPLLKVVRNIGLTGVDKLTPLKQKFIRHAMGQ